MATERQVQLAHRIAANLSTNGDRTCVDFHTEPAAKEFDWKGFLLLFGFEEHRKFHLLLRQFDASTRAYRSIGYGQSYCLESVRVEAFLEAVNQLLMEYFQPFADSTLSE